MEKKPLPALKELYKGDLDTKRENDLNILLNHEPKQQWIKSHPIASGVKYIPIEVIEYLLTSIFIRWHVEVKQIQVIANSVVVTVRLHYQHPIDGEMRWQDGVGASPIQTAKDAGATDFTQVKSDAVMKSAPAAESFAVKDAAEKLGKLFGKDLNRKDAFGYDSLGNKFDMATQEQMMYITRLAQNVALDENQQAALDAEMMEGITATRANEIIINLERDQIKPEHRQKDIQEKLNIIMEDEKK